MLSRSYLDESRPSLSFDGSSDGNSGQCLSCHKGIDPARQPACRCGYRVCQPCWQIAANFGGACPACGWPPDKESGIQERGVRPNYDHVVGNRSRSSSSSGSTTPGRIDHHEQQQQQGSAAVAIQRVSSGASGAAERVGGGGPQPQQQQQGVFIRGADRRVLQNLRVIQRTLVYAIGLTPTIAKASTLKQPEYFGQYGEITKLVINHHQGVSPEDPRYGSASAYITFSRQEDAWAAICSVDGFRLMGRTIRASFGTTKYCNSFLRNLPCNNPECLYLHELGDEGDRFTKDEVQLGLARHGSSFAFKEEVLGAGSDCARSFPRQGSGTGGSGPQPLNPVLPPPCPMTPLRLASAAQATYAYSAYDESMGVGVGAMSGGSGGAGGVPFAGHNSLTAVQSPPRWSIDQQGNVVAGAGGARGLIGVEPVSPAPVGADGRPRPRRRRGQRGRRGGGAGAGGAGGAVNGNGTHGGNAAGRIGGNGDTEVFTGYDFEPEEGCMFGPGGLCLVAPQAEWGQGGAGSSGIGSASGLTANDVEQLAPLASRSRPTAASVCMPTRRPSSSSMSSSQFLGVDEQKFRAGSGSGDRSCGDLGVLVGPKSTVIIGGVGSNSDVFHPAMKQPSTWGGSERSVASSRSAGGSSYNGSSAGCNSSSYWGEPFGPGRGSPLDTPETLTSTPPVELSPSNPASPPTSSSFSSLSSLSSRGLWDLGGIGAGRTRNNSGISAGDDRDMEAAGNRGPGRPGTGVYSHRVLQVRSPPAFFGLGGEGGRGSGGGDSLGSILEVRQHDQHQTQQMRGQSLDLSFDDQSDGSRRQQQHWNSAVGSSSLVIREATPGGREAQHRDTAAAGNMRSTASAPPGLTLPARSENEVVGPRHSGDVYASNGRHNNGSAVRDHRSLSGENAGDGDHRLGARGVSEEGEKSGSGLGGKGDGGVWATQTALMAFDPFSSSNTATASQDEASRWRRATPRLLA